MVTKLIYFNANPHFYDSLSRYTKSKFSFFNKAPLKSYSGLNNGYLLKNASDKN